MGQVKRKDSQHLFILQATQRDFPAGGASLGVSKDTTKEGTLAVLHIHVL